MLVMIVLLLFNYLMNFKVVITYLRWSAVNLHLFLFFPQNFLFRRLTSGFRKWRYCFRSRLLQATSDSALKINNSFQPLVRENVKKIKHYRNCNWKRKGNFLYLFFFFLCRQNNRFHVRQQWLVDVLSEIRNHKRRRVSVLCFHNVRYL